MKLEFLHPEPDLEFGDKGKCHDIRFGIGHYGTFDYQDDRGPREIRIGLVGTEETINAITEWLKQCKEEIPAKPSKQPRLYPPFPGFATTHGFYSKLIWDVNNARLVTLPDNLSTKRKHFNRTVKQVVEAYVEEVTNLLERLDAHVVICAPPLEHLKITTQILEEPVEESEDADEEESDEEEGPTVLRSKFDFHDFLKARTLHLRVPIQIVLPATYDESKKAAQKKIMNRDQQDEATRAWNLHTALYYKARGVPWRMVRDTSELSTCYLGVSFFRTLDRQRIYASSAQVFNQLGEGVIVRGGLAFEKENRQIYLDKNGAMSLAAKALDAFWNEHYHYPARVVLHKTSPYTEDETKGFTQALKEKGIKKIDLLHMKESFNRLFRTSEYATLRGTLWHLEDRKAILYTRGSVYFYETYPGKYPPRSLFVNSVSSDRPFKELLMETQALTKMNWNTTRFDGHLPITLRAARQVGRILKYVDEDDVPKIPAAYRYYM